MTLGWRINYTSAHHHHHLHRWGSSTTVSAADETLEISQWQWHVVVSCLRRGQGDDDANEKDDEMSRLSVSVLPCNKVDGWRGRKSSELMFNKWLPSRTKTLIKNFSHNYLALQDEDGGDWGQSNRSHLQIQTVSRSFQDNSIISLISVPSTEHVIINCSLRMCGVCCWFNQDSPLPLVKRALCHFFTNYVFSGCLSQLSDCSRQAPHPRPNCSSHMT